MAISLFWAATGLLVLVAYLSLDIMGFLSWRNKFQVEGRVGFDHDHFL
jgi:3-dehydrosphinganine reductase